MTTFLKGIHAGKPALFQLFVLLLLALLGAVLSSMLAMGIFYLTYGFNANIYQYPDMMRILQLFSSLGTFLFPALGVAWTCSSDPKAYLSIGRIPSGHILLLTLVCMFLLSPTITLTGLVNKQMELPAFMAPIEEWMRRQEKIAEDLTISLLAGKSIFTLISNLVVIALAAGITEEFLFRGAIQRILGQWFHNHHAIIWTAAFLFSAFHMQFFGFIPRMLLGAYFGYLLYWSRNIWLPVFAHFVNNAFAVIGMSNANLKENEFITGDITTQHLLPYAAGAVIALYLFYICNRRLRSLLQ